MKNKTKFNWKLEFHNKWQSSYDLVLIALTPNNFENPNSRRLSLRYAPRYYLKYNLNLSIIDLNYSCRYLTLIKDRKCVHEWKSIKDFIKVIIKTDNGKRLIVYKRGDGSFSLFHTVKENFLIENIELSFHDWQFLLIK